MAIQTLVLDPITLTLVLSGVMTLAIVIIYVIAAVLRRGRISVEGDEMYIGGESEEVLRNKVPSVLALYWGILSRAWRRSVKYLRDSIHTGVLNDWYGYMGMWLSLLLIVAIVAILIYVK
ncbi:hypothetical protein QPL79_03970 [Ignisphaera sp. 4213-co]|uniref:Sodium:proton antiporter n=1 Tax=Ignisphaera cupida TaxID=3050454 RepID=A0ABD4Z6F7_9CREN|nr:hypothetical protein [Ignisphaera sp. 4213-co]MDK6028513.1 hypothetical protein [Ignisphaera sp. 4213-co]